MKNFILEVAYTNFEDEWEREKLNESYNSIITGGGVSQVNPVDFDKNFLALCNLMEEHGSSNPSEYSVLQFYAKLNYISEKLERENERGDQVSS